MTKLLKTLAIAGMLGGSTLMYKGCSDVLNADEKLIKQNKKGIEYNFNNRVLNEKSGLRRLFGGAILILSGMGYFTYRQDKE